MINYLYICSSGHSGSTLLDLLIGSHSQVESLGEITQFPKNVALNTPCTCGEPVRTCPLWLRVIERINNSRGFDLIKNPYRLNLGFIGARVIVDKKHQTPMYRLKAKLMHGLNYGQLRLGLPLPGELFSLFNSAAENTFFLYDIVRDLRKCRIVVDSSKGYLKAIHLYKKNPKAVRLIFLTRDGRGVLYSNLKRKFSRGGSVKDWRRYYSRALSLIDRHVAGEHVLRIRYEDLAADPRKQLERVCEFAGIEFETEMLDFAGHTHHITNGNNMRFRKQSEIRLDNAWQSNLAPSDLDYFDRIAGRLNKTFGYY